MKRVVLAPVKGPEQDVARGKNPKGDLKNLCVAQQNTHIRGHVLRGFLTRMCPRDSTYTETKDAPAPHPGGPPRAPSLVIPTLPPAHMVGTGHRSFIPSATDESRDAPTLGLSSMALL